ncbi:MAG: 3-dehydroquinate synthase [Oscillospiraceae bacterium]|jgi:3-dehydroquinate synthase
MSAEIGKIRVSAGEGYDISVGSGLLDSVGENLGDIRPGCSIAVFSDSNVAPLYLSRVEGSLRASGFKTSSFVFPAGEKSKNMGTITDMLEFMASSGITRTDAAAALGGGVTGDMAGFASGIYMRGIKFVQIPTTLLAMVDSSVGGKCAADLREGKNLAGVFHQPSSVVCDTDTLGTLPPEVFSDGLAEAIKTGILRGEELFSRFESNAGTDGIETTIMMCIEYKKGIVEQDEKELGIRKLLNLGHTAGHAVEKLSGYTVQHGHAVAAGTSIISSASEHLGWSEPGTAARIKRVLSGNGLPVSCGYSPEQLAEAALSDKKRSGNEVTLVIPEKIGHCTLRTVPVGDLAGIFRAGMEDA